MEIAVKATYAHLVKDESLVQNSDKLYIVEFHFDQSWDGYAKSAVFEWQTLTVPFAFSSSSAIGLPTMLLRV